jgi:hypothetical protein
MATITEDYVSFETAKLLKEKGFDVYGDGSFGSETKIWMEYSPFGKIRDVSSSRPSIKGYPAPTLQMAMKWLRNTFHLEIYPFHDAIQENNDWWYRIEHHSKGCSLIKYESDVIYETHEQACEAAIKYCLVNLI